jgi:hypothetical protein
MVKRAPNYEFTMESLRVFERLYVGLVSDVLGESFEEIPPALRRDLTATLNKGKVSKHNQL